VTYNIHKKEKNWVRTAKGNTPNRISQGASNWGEGGRKSNLIQELQAQDEEGTSGTPGRDKGKNKQRNQLRSQSRTIGGRESRKKST